MDNTYGVTPEGFRRKTVENIIDEMQADQLSTMYEDLDVSDESVIGQQNAIVGQQFGEGWEQLEQLYNCGDIDAVEDRALENLCKMVGVIRNGDTKSTVTLKCTLAAGTTLTPGQQFAQNRDQPDVRWTPVAGQQDPNVPEYVAASTDILDVIFEAENEGPVEAVANTITVIATPVNGWNGVSQPTDAQPGKRIEDDTTLKQRRSRELATMGSATTRAIQAKVSEAFSPQILTLAVYENDKDYADDEGRPPHSVEVLIFDGDPEPTENNDHIAQTIVDAGVGGIPTTGNKFGTAQVLDGTSTISKMIRFSRPTPRPVYLAFDLVKASTGYPGNDALKEYIARQANALHLPGIDVAWSLLSSLAFGKGGVFKCMQVRLGFAPSPTDHEIDLTISLREIARFNTANITINAT